MQLHYQSDKRTFLQVPECIPEKEGSNDASLPSSSEQPVYFLSAMILRAQLDTIGSPEQELENIINCKGVRSLTKKFLSHDSVVILRGKSPVSSETHGNQHINRVWLSQSMLLCCCSFFYIKRLYCLTSPLIKILKQ